MSETQKPTVGRIVHFHDAGGPYPAIICAVNEGGTVELATFGKNSLYFQHSVPFNSDEVVSSEVNAAGTWTWPPRT